MSKKELNDGYYYEALDRLHVIIENIDNHLLNHKVCEKHKKIRKKVEKGLEILADAYQLVGQKVK